MRALALAAALSLPLAAPATADGAVPVTLPDVSWLTDAQAEALVTALVRATVFGQNCPQYYTTDGEWQLLTDTADALSDRLGITDAAELDAQFWNPAFAALDEKAACERYWREVPEAIDLLKDMGGLDYAGPVKG